MTKGEEQPPTRPAVNKPSHIPPAATPKTGGHLATRQRGLSPTPETEPPARPKALPDVRESRPGRFARGECSREELRVLRPVLGRMG